VHFGLHQAASGLSPAIVAALIAVPVGLLTLIVQWLGVRRVGRDTNKQLEQQAKDLDRTLAEQRDHLDRSLADQRQRTLNERFATAADRLGTDSPAPVRLAAVYAMAGLADDWPENRQTCVNVLCGYLRMPYPPDPGEDAGQADQLAFQGDREVRHTAIRVIGDHLRASAANSWSDLFLNFRGVRFDEADFRGAHFAGGVSFVRAHFAGGVTFAEAKFSAWASFYGAEFSDGLVSFQEAEFCGGEVYFEEAAFSGGAASFSQARFTDGQVNFDRARLSGSSVGFAEAEFRGSEVSFNEVEIFDGTVFFKSAKFAAGRVSFSGATFNGGIVSLERAEFCGSQVSFGKAEFSGGTVLLSHAKFAADQVSFNRARFSGGIVSFDQAQFCGSQVSFDEAEFSDDIKLVFHGASFAAGQVSFMGQSSTAAGLASQMSKALARWRSNPTTRRRRDTCTHSRRSYTLQRTEFPSEGDVSDATHQIGPHNHQAQRRRRRAARNLQAGKFWL
jgi:uncharacterized protein YjbI with pentapeptide repeats